MIDPTLRELISNSLFSVDNFEQVWLELNQLYDQLGFEDFWNDEDKIKEYKWITQQLRKYMASKKQEIMACNSLRDMADKVEELIEKQNEYGDNRAEIAYNFMRDHWLVQLHNILSNVAATEENPEEEE